MLCKSGICGCPWACNNNIPSFYLTCKKLLDGLYGVFQRAGGLRGGGRGAACEGIMKGGLGLFWWHTLNIWHNSGCLSQITYCTFNKCNYMAIVSLFKRAIRPSLVLHIFFDILKCTIIILQQYVPIVSL